MSELLMCEPLHRVLREVLRNYTSLKASAEGEAYSLTICRVRGCIWTDGSTASKGHDGPCKLLDIHFLDLQKCLKGLSKRKREAVFYNVILDMKQKDVAEVMGITTVSVGQYVDQAMIQVAKELWPEEAD